MKEHFYNFLYSIDRNGFEVLIAAGLANVIAQWMKTAIVAWKKKKFNMAILFSTGGMPSSHSSTVVAMATSVGLIAGFNSVSFAIGATVASVVMYDAAGVRRAASRQAVVLNQIIQNLFQNHPELNRGKLKELLGHSPTEVIAGAGLGIVVSIAFRYWLNDVLY